MTPLETGSRYHLMESKKEGFLLLRISFHIRWSRENHWEQFVLARPRWWSPVLFFFFMYVCTYPNSAHDGWWMMVVCGRVTRFETYFWEIHTILVLTGSQNGNLTLQERHHVRYQGSQTGCMIPPPNPYYYVCTLPTPPTFCEWRDWALSHLLGNRLN